MKTINKSSALLLAATFSLSAVGATTQNYENARQRFTTALEQANQVLAAEAAARDVGAVLGHFNTAQIALCDLTGYWHEDKHSTKGKKRAEKTLNTGNVPDYLTARRQELNDLLGRIMRLDLNRLQELRGQIQQNIEAITQASDNIRAEVVHIEGAEEQQAQLDAQGNIIQQNRVQLEQALDAFAPLEQ